MSEHDANVSRMVALGLMKVVGFHDGAPRYALTWAGRCAVYRSYLRDLHELIAEIMRSPIDAYAATAALTALAALGIIAIVNAVGRAHGVSI